MRPLRHQRPARRFRSAVLPLLAVSLLAGCAATAPDADEVRAEGVSLRVVSPAEAAALPEVVAASSSIGLTALGLAPRSGNAVVSPASLTVALAMLAEGAQRATLDALEQALGASGEERRDAFAALRGAVLAFDGDPAEATGETLPERPIVHLANRVVVDEGFEVHDAFLEALAEGFDAGVLYTDLGSPSAKAVLSEWIEEHTGGLIEESAIEPRPDLRVVLQDALLLAARWQTPFEASGTAALPFTLADGSTVDTRTMSSAGPAFAYAQSDGWQAVRLPYADALHADVLLPPEGVDPAEASPQLLAELSRALDAAVPEAIELRLPTLEVKPEPFDLLDSGVFDAIGVGAVLCSSGSADLSGIALEPGELCLGQAAQQTVLQVDEEGTVAAAVTELGAVESAAPAIERQVHFDRPFLFTVAHAETGWPLFLAAVRDPRH